MFITQFKKHNLKKDRPGLKNVFYTSLFLFLIPISMLFLMYCDVKKCPKIKVLEDIKYHYYLSVPTHGYSSFPFADLIKDKYQTDQEWNDFLDKSQSVINDIECENATGISCLSQSMQNDYNELINKAGSFDLNVYDIINVNIEAIACDIEIKITDIETKNETIIITITLCETGSCNVHASGLFWFAIENKDKIPSYDIVINRFSP